MMAASTHTDASLVLTSMESGRIVVSAMFAAVSCLRRPSAPLTMSEGRDSGGAAPLTDALPSGPAQKKGSFQLWPAPGWFIV